MVFGKKGDIHWNYLIPMIIAMVVISISIFFVIGDAKGSIMDNIGLMIGTQSEILGNQKEIKSLTKEEVEKELKKDFFKTNKDIIEEYAKKNDIEPELLQALILTEGGYGVDFKDSVRFECHKFNEFIESKKIKCSCSNNNYCTIDAKKSFSTVSSETDYDAYQKAKDIDAKIAFKSSSSGFAQMMGFNYEWLEFPVDSDTDIKEVEDKKIQFEYFFKFLEKKEVIKPMQKKDWEKIAKAYNGEKYKQNDYDLKLKNNYNNIKSLS